MLTGAEVLIFDEPTRGIDIGAKAEVYRLIHQLAGQGAAIILVSSELPELMNVCHRIIVMSGGRVQDELSEPEFTERRILAGAFAAHMSECWTNFGPGIELMLQAPARRSDVALDRGPAIGRSTCRRSNSSVNTAASLASLLW